MTDRSTEGLPIISVIVPHLNQADHLERCLESLKRQSFNAGPVEIIVVDNGSKTLPMELCARFGARLLEEATPGPGPARNRGVSSARADILAFIDADCLADPNWLATIDASLSRDRSGGLIGGDVRIALTDKDHPTMIECYESVFAFRQKEYITTKGFSGTGNLAMRRAIYDAVGPFKGIEIAEDREWGQRATRLGFVTEYVPAMIVYHPARKTFDELFVKWDRQMAHDVAERGGTPLGRARLLIRSLAVAASPILEARRILGSPRISGARQRWLAARALVRVRLYRARRMTALLFGDCERGAKMEPAIVSRPVGADAGIGTGV